MKKFLTSIWFLSVLIAAPIIFFMPSLFEKYVVKEVSREAINFHMKDVRVYYNDLFNENKKRRVLSGNFEIAKELKSVAEYSIDRPVIKFYGNPGRFYPRLFFGDTNNNSRKEIIGFSYSSDSLFLNISELGVDEFKLHPNNQKYFVEFPDKTNSRWTSILSGDFIDLDNDGSDEFVFSVVSHAMSSVRSAIMVFDSQEQKIKSTETIGDQFRNLQFIDLDNDGFQEIIADGANAISNSCDWVSLNTGNPYLKIIDRNLKFKFSPLKFKSGETNTVAFTKNDKTHLFCLSNTPLSRKPQSVLYKLNKRGDIIDSLEIAVVKRANITNVSKTNDGNIFVFTEKGKIHKISQELEILGIEDLGIDGNDLIIAGEYDINEDGVKDYFCSNFKTGDHFIYTDQFLEHIKIGNQLIAPHDLNCKIEKNLFFSQDEDYSYIFKLRKNTYRHLQFPVYAGVYLLVVFLAFIIRKTQEARLKEKYELQNKVRELQLQSLNNQLDPHFIFNTFNTVASVIRQGKSENAYNLMVRFSKLVRQNMEGSGDIYTTLQKELNFIEDYLSIQKFRFKELLDYSIVKPRNVNAVKIPKLLIQIHVENALKHGIRPSNKRGMLKVIVKYEVDSVLIEVEDNGVGRSKSKKLKTQGQGIGLKAIKEIIEINNINSKHKITQQIIDLKDAAGLASGTRVCLKVTV